MKKLVILFFTMLVISNNALAEDKWFANDKAYHVGAGIAISGACNVLKTSDEVSYVAPFAVGVLKELSDDEFNIGDVIATGIGGIIGNIIIKTIF